MEPRHPERIRLATCLAALALAAGIATAGAPREARAVRLFTPYGGKLESVTPAAGCTPIRAAVFAATAGTVDLQVDEVKTGSPSRAILGLLKVSSVPTMPLPTNIYNRTRFVFPTRTGVWTLGNSLNICDICGKVQGIPFLENICDTSPIKEIVDAACDLVSATCPITNLIFNIGSGSTPSF